MILANWFSPVWMSRSVPRHKVSRGVAARGGHAAVDCQDVRPVRPGTEGALASYCLKGTTMRWSTEGSRTSMAILSDLESKGEGFALWEEFSAAVSADRRVQVITSRRIDSLCTGPRHHVDR